MANKYRGEIAAELGGQPYRLCLTLGALAELEAAFESSDLVALVKRFETGHLAARDLIRILGAGLRGAGHDMSDLQLSQLPHPGGVQGYVQIAADLLAATFGAQTPPGAVPPKDQPANPPVPQSA